VPADLPVELSILAIVGGTFGSAETIADRGSGGVLSKATTSGVAAGGGADVAYEHEPGELVLGARYLVVSLGRLSNGDQLVGNAGGLLFDLGFRLRF